MIIQQMQTTKAGFNRNSSRKNLNRPLLSRHGGRQEEFLPSAGKMRQTKGFTPDGEVTSPRQG
jgi:hypothetical protein